MQFPVDSQENVEQEIGMNFLHNFPSLIPLVSVAF